MLQYQNIKIFLQNFIFQICLKDFLWRKELKILCGIYMLLVILKVKKLLEPFTKKNCEKPIKKS